MAELKSKTLIVLKGLLFLGIALTTATLLLLESPTDRTAALASLLIWSSCRFYYFLFYVLAKYVDTTYCYAGIWAQLRAIRRNQRRQP